MRNEENQCNFGSNQFPCSELWGLCTLQTQGSKYYQGCDGKKDNKDLYIKLYQTVVETPTPPPSNETQPDNNTTAPDNSTVSDNTTDPVEPEPEEPETPARVCCDAMFSSCLACKANITEEEYCVQNPET